MDALTTARSIVGVVLVGETKDMAELMTDGADAVEDIRTFSAVHLGRTGVTLNGDSVETHTKHLGSMGPQEVGVVARSVGTVTGKNEIDHVGLAVAIAVVAREVDELVGGTTG